MKKRHIPYKSCLPEQNLDSFLDILTNTVGVLIFTSLFMTLVAVESGTIIRTPLVTPSQKDFHLFEIKQNRVFYVDTDMVQEQIKEFVSSLQTCNKPEEPYGDSLYDYENYLQELYQYRDCVINKREQLKNFSVQTEYYEVKLIDLDSFAWEYDLKKTVTGENSEELSQAHSNFREVLKKINPQKDYLAFIVRPDSFSAFRQARKLAWQEGFDVGWEPSNSDTPIILGSQGRTIGVQ